MRTLRQPEPTLTRADAARLALASAVLLATVLAATPLAQSSRPATAAAREVVRLDALLDLDQPALRSVVEVAQGKGIGPAVAALRKHHVRLPRQPYLRYGLRPMTQEQAAGQADLVLEEGFRIGRRESFPLEVPVDWAADPFKDRSWRFHLNAWTFLEPVLMAFEGRRKPEYIHFARKIALDWSARNIERPVPNPFAWYDMAVGRRATVLAVVLDDALRDASVPDEDVLTLLRAARRHARELADPTKLAGHSNHGIYQLAGLLALATTVPELVDAQTHRRHALVKLRRLFKSHFSDEGIHLEHSPEYQVYLVNILGLLLETGWVPENSSLHGLFDRASGNLIWMIAPDGRVVRVGDADGATAADRIIFTHNDALRFVLTRGVEGRPPPKHWAVFPKSGYVTFRSPWSDDPWEKASFLFFSAAFHSRTHKHADDFTFEWSELGVPLIIDSGRFAYHYDDPRRKYVESTRAHNTVEIDGRDYSRYRNDAFGSAVKAWGEVGGVYFVEAQVYRKRFFKTDHRRVLFFSPGRWLVVVDLMDSPDEHGFTQWFHLNPDIELEADGKRAVAAIPGTKKQLLMLPLLNRDKMGLRLVRGQKTPRLQGWVSLEANVLKPNHAAGYTIKDNRATFVTLLWIGDEASKVSPGKTRVGLGGDALFVSWKGDDRMHGFHFVKRGGKRQLDLIKQDER